MREGVTYKRLGDVASYVNGYAFKPETWTDHGLPIVRIQNLNKPDAEYNYFAGELPDKFIINDGDLLISWSASLGAYFWNGGKAYLNQHIFKVVFDKSDIDKSYLKYAVESKLLEMKRNVHGSTMQHIVKGDFDNTKIPVPSLGEQQRIVSELDRLASIIADKQQQLRELDNLAQAIFYTMFGDPLTNPKGWETKKLGDICDTTSGGTPKTTHKEYYDGGTIPWLRSGEVAQGLIKETELFITQAGLENSSAKIVPVNTVSIAMYGATVGAVGIIQTPMCTNQAVCNILPTDEIAPTYLMYFLIGMKPRYISVAAGGAQPNISQTVVRDTAVMLPPLDLQQQFAEKVKTIEEQKDVLKQSIAEFENLLAQRMEYHFA